MGEYIWNMPKSPNRKKSAVYLRVSTDEQSVRSQKHAVLEFCRGRGWKNLKLYEETASGAKTSRPVLETLIRDARAGEVARVIAYKLDRIGRSLVHLALIIEELGRLNVPMVFTSQGIDTSDQNPAGRLQLGVLMAVAEFERANIRERTRVGQAAARERGSVFGRPTTAAKQRGEIRKLRNAGKTVRVVARELGISIASVSRLSRGKPNATKVTKH
jgi:DNA invertase Pin-like site-specific DNA recombinase